MFLEKDIEKCIYLIKFYKDGLPALVLIDDFLITQYEVPTGNSPPWAHLIEKAWAKLHGTYLDSFNLNMAPHEIYRDLTWAETQCVDINSIDFKQIE